ncbi:MAG TPA: catalase [Kofleriaceae bacterium]|nr:catalase [Kofleriaceae bacterium]
MAKHSTNGGATPEGSVTGSGGELHQLATDTVLTTNQGVPISDDQNSLTIGPRGPTLLEDFHFLEKLTHFDHERIPERIVHARGSALHGSFAPYECARQYSRAQFLQYPKVRTPVFVRFSTVAGGAGSIDLPRDVRGFATKFYTSEGVFDLVGNNIPVFFIQDALKFPDLIHAVKMEPDRGFPQAASAHDTFWDFVSLMPETMHMLMWAMSDRALPRSLRMMEGFGVNTYRLVDAAGTARFVKWHWRPAGGSASVLWDEACKINGADHDFHRRDLYTAIQRGIFPEFELAIQAVTEEEAERLPFDILDATKLIPEEVVPLVPIGKMVLDRWPDNFFAETEQAAFHPGHLVPGIEFSDDPLLQGRIFSYTDTQLKRLGGPNFHELEINRPKCPMHNFQRDGMARFAVDRGRVSYEPSSLAPGSPRETPSGFATYPRVAAGNKVRQRSPTFADHYSQARMFWRSMTPPEQHHIVNAFTFELSKVETVAIRTRMLGHLRVIDPGLHDRVATAMGMQGMADEVRPAVPPRDLPPSPSLSLLAKAPPTLVGRKVGVLVGDGFDRELVAQLVLAVEKEQAMLELVALRIGGALAADGAIVAVDHIISAGPSVIFDAVAVVPGASGIADLIAEPAAVAWVQDAFIHCKVIATVAEARPLLAAARVPVSGPCDGVIELAGGAAIPEFIAAARRGRVWSREPIGPDKLPIPAAQLAGAAGRASTPVAPGKR